MAWSAAKFGAASAQALTIERAVGAGRLTRELYPGRITCATGWCWRSAAGTCDISVEPLSVDIIHRSDLDFTSPLFSQTPRICDLNGRNALPKFCISPLG